VNKAVARIRSDSPAFDRDEFESAGRRRHGPESRLLGWISFWARFHSALRTKADQTSRYLAALQNPDIQILGHPRGRIYQFSNGIEGRLARVFAQAAKLDKAVEIDSYPDRQDLNLALLKIARKNGVRIFVRHGLASRPSVGIHRTGSGRRPQSAHTARSHFEFHGPCRFAGVDCEAAGTSPLNYFFFSAFQVFLKNFSRPDPA